MTSVYGEKTLRVPKMKTHSSTALTFKIMILQKTQNLLQVLLRVLRKYFYSLVIAAILATRICEEIFNTGMFNMVRETLTVQRLNTTDVKK